MSLKWARKFSKWIEMDPEMLEIDSEMLTYCFKSAYNEFPTFLQAFSFLPKQAFVELLPMFLRPHTILKTHYSP